ncbi:MAG TPA: hypothetical protein VEF89_04655 [Solirubrobacteraceae bacterium]|nr:hypothetical protein [Solirubrobacteraceae bacterium]
MRLLAGVNGAARELGSHNQSEFANRPDPSIVITPAYTDITGYSMGGIGTFKLGAQIPDLFARAPADGRLRDHNNVLASLRNVPVLMWNARPTSW